MRNRMMRSIRFLLMALVMFGVPAAALAQVSVSVNIAPPELPVYDQPICPGDGYIWTPGYWAWDGDYNDYYWVPGTWVEAPEVGFFWTPGYWGWGNGGYFFNQGYWGPQIGFYGGINYGFGYFGDGYVGGRWDNGHFFYNRDVSNVNVNVIHNVYEQKVTNRQETRVSFNGGNGGIQARPSAREEAAAHERHVAPVAAQTQHIQEARSNQNLRASVNHGKPPIAATDKPGAFTGGGAVAAKEGGRVNTAPGANGNNGGRPANNETRPANNETRPANNPATNNEPRPANTAVHPKELPPIERPATPSTGNPKVDQKYQQQQQKLTQKQDQERQQLQQKQDQEHAKLAQQKAPPAKTQQIEQKHQQQTQQLSQKHTQQQQQLQQKQKPAPKGPPHKGPGGQD